MVTLRSLTLTTCACLALSTQALAQRSTTRGFTLGLDVGGSAIAFENGDENTGGHGGLRIGYGFNRIVTVYAGFYGATLDVEDNTSAASVTLGHADLGVRLHFANSNRRFIPFGDVAFTPRFLRPDDDTAVSINGGSFTLGGGLAFYLARQWALEASAKWSTGEFSEVDLGNVQYAGLDIDARSGRFNLGVTWWP